MGVDFGSEDVLVAEHLLDHPEVSPVLYQMGGKRVPEGVGRYFLVDSGKDGLSLDNIEHRDK